MKTFRSRRTSIRTPWAASGGSRTRNARRGAGVGRRARPAGRRRGLVPALPARRRRPEHVLHPGLRAVRRRPLGYGRRRRQPPPVRVHLSQPRHDHADLPEPGHPRGDADLPPALADRRGRQPPGALHARLGRGCASGRWRVNPAVAEALGLDTDYAAAPSRLLHAAARRRREVRPHDLALPRDARRHRPRARGGGRGGDLLPRRRPPQPARLSGQGRQPAHRALLDARAGGDGGPGRRPPRPAEHGADRHSC